MGVGTRRSETLYAAEVNVFDLLLASGMRLSIGVGKSQDFHRKNNNIFSPRVTQNIFSHYYHYVNKVLPPCAF